MASKKTRRGPTRYWPRVLLIIPLLLVIWVPFYNTIEPELGGIPFFYWYQLAAILVGAATVLTVYLLERRATRGRGRADTDLDPSGTTGDIL